MRKITKKRSYQAIFLLNDGYFSYFCAHIKSFNITTMRNIPIVTKNLLIINILAFAAMYVLKMRGIDINDIFGLHFFLASDFHIYQLFTYMFMHAGFEHVFFNMFALWMFGCVVENVWGPKKFLFYYISCGMGAGLLQMITQFVSFYLLVSGQDPSIGITEAFQLGQTYSTQLNVWTTVGASGAIYAILLAFGMIFPEERIFIFPLPIPIKAKWFVMLYAGVELFMALGTSGDNVAHFAHLGGMLFGFMMIKYWQKNPGNIYGRSRGEEFFDRMRNNWERRSNKKSDFTRQTDHDEYVRNETDWDYNTKKKAEQEEIDRILDKIRKSGYDSLSAEEKRRLFDASNKK